MRKALVATVMTAGLVLAPAMGSVSAQGTETVEEDDGGDKTGLLGLFGLLGLAGLAGLKRRDHDNVRHGSTPGASAVR